MHNNRLESVVSSLRRQIDTLNSLSESVHGIRIRQTSEYKEVSVVVGGNGLLLDLSIESPASQITARKLASVIINTYQKALTLSMQEQTMQIEKFLATK